ncbi:alpha/beta fold hydrolase [Paenibacillus glycinis]|uniref:Alpha/beta fold hydrolase n=1 Tax=Paenibacillus glycinis TaxID=2697035 RepID=A0ABW9XSP8_9BACL|nr:alpha/beta fold hydrolase [Paenibacillus glycinis]NBD25645.1 alpha/beta fold hydrolase [Paenibacillus glycinis]
MSTFVLVHGSWHGAWCWDKVVPLLQNAGHRVVAIDLPGHGLDTMPVQEITLQDYTDRLCSVLDNETEQVILVGHSSGGLAITQTAEYRPDKIRTLVYLCAYLPQDGQSLLQVIQSELMVPAVAAPPSAVVISDDQTYMSLDGDRVKANLYGDCSDEDVEFAKDRLCLDPMATFLAPVQLTPQNFGSVPRVYIETLQDIAISIGLQRQMYGQSPCREVITMDTAHSPFFSQPEALSQHLHHIAETSID